MTVIGIDPGERTGIAIFRQPPVGRVSRVAERETLTLTMSQLFEKLPEMLVLERQRAGWRVARRADNPGLTVVVEDWRLFGDRALSLVGGALPGPEALGWIVGTCHRLTDVECHRSQPSAKRPVFAQLAVRGIELAGRNQHERDAEVHAIGWLLRAQSWPYVAPGGEGEHG